MHGLLGLHQGKRGASRVEGINVNPNAVRKAKLLAGCLGTDVDFRLLNIETEQLDEDFDYILCLNLLHHLENPLTLLEKVIKHTKRSLILEVAGQPFQDDTV